MIHYSNRENRQVSPKERVDRIRRTQSLFWLYFKEPMPVSIMEEHECDLEQSPQRLQSSCASFETSRWDAWSYPQSPPKSSSSQQDDGKSRSRKAASTRATQSWRREEDTDVPSDEEDSDVLCQLGMMEI
jgi:hypothetical protein